MEERPRWNLITIIREMEDPRMERTRLHKLEDILVIAICALLCGVESFEDMEVFGEAKKEWFDPFLELPNGIPSHDTFGRVFAAMDPEKFLKAFMRWTQSLREVLCGEVVAIDGKALRRAIDKGQSPKVIASHGLATRPPGTLCAAWAWSKPHGKSTEKSAWNAATI